MNASADDTRLIELLLELDEPAVLNLVAARLQAGADPLVLIEKAQEGMRQVGTRYEQRQYYLSGLMMAGEIFRQVMELVEPVLVQRVSGDESGHILLGTIRGDIHDIGKNIFITLLRCHGFTVSDLGVDIPPEQFAAQAMILKPDIIGISGLLTTSYDEMKTAVEELHQLDDPQVKQTPVIIGGGVLNAMVCAYVGAQYWAIDAMVGVELCKQMLAGRIENAIRD